MNKVNQIYKNPINKFSRLARLFGGGRIYSLSAITQNVDGSMNIRNKRLNSKQEVHACYSVSKSVTAMCLGILFDQGLVDPEDKIAKYLSEYFPSDVDENWYQVTITQMLHHHTGTIVIGDFDHASSIITLHSEEDGLTVIFKERIDLKKQQSFIYSDGNYYVIARIIKKITGQDLEAFAQKHIFTPLGFCNNAWARDRNGNVLGGTGLFLRTEDFAKYAWVWLNDGVFQNSRIVSSKWVQFALDTTEYDDGQNYGYGIRKRDNDLYCITGAINQCALLDMQKKYVVAWHSGKHNCLEYICILLHKRYLL